VVAAFRAVVVVVNFVVVVVVAFVFVVILSLAYRVFQVEFGLMLLFLLCIALL